MTAPVGTRILKPLVTAVLTIVNALRAGSDLSFRLDGEHKSSGIRLSARLAFPHAGLPLRLVATTSRLLPPSSGTSLLSPPLNSLTLLLHLTGPSWRFYRVLKLIRPAKYKL